MGWVIAHSQVGLPLGEVVDNRQELKAIFSPLSLEDRKEKWNPRISLHSSCFHRLQH